MDRRTTSTTERAAFGGRRLCVAPMMERTDRHCRYFLRLLAPNARLYTEMITAAALLRGDAAKLLRFDTAEHPVALQLGGSEPDALAAAAKLGAAAGYDEINLNVGCPSDRVQAGCFGAALMREPRRVASCVAAMAEASPAPITVKTRLGVDEHDSYEFLCDFVGAVAEAGCGTVIVHARKAWLKGLSPKQNRDVPPLDYPRVHRLKRDFAALEIVLNGGLAALEPAIAQLAQVDGVMLGRAAYHDPMLLARLDQAIFGGASPTRVHAVEAFVAYAEGELRAGTPLNAMLRHLMGLFTARPGGRRWRKTLAEWPRAGKASARLGELVALATELDSPTREPRAA
ncbi:MAG TPA: tRNA dihydrouridine(20/20a) synthase DusA [Gammaproteobacteria bacterium]